MVISTPTVTAYMTIVGRKQKFYTKIFIQSFYFFFVFKENMTAVYTENGAVNLICSSSMELNIIYGFYGVPSCSTCSCTSCNCSAMNVTSRVSSQCTGLTSCSFTANNALFGDPCSGFLKTFIVTYFCSNSCPTRSTGMYQICSTFSTYI